MYSLSRCSGVGKVPSVIIHFDPHVLQCSYFCSYIFDLYIETYGLKRVYVSIYLLLAYWNVLFQYYCLCWRVPVHHMDRCCNLVLWLVEVDLHPCEFSPDGDACRCSDHSLRRPEQWPYVCSSTALFFFVFVFFPGHAVPVRAEKWPNWSLFFWNFLLLVLPSLLLMWSLFY